MKRIKIISSFALLSALTLGVLFAQSPENEYSEPRKMKITIVTDNNGSVQKTIETIEVNSREDVHEYLKSKGIKVKELEFYHSRPKIEYPNIWVMNRLENSGSQKVMVVDVREESDIENNNGENKEVIVKAIVVKDDDGKNSESDEKQEIRIEKTTDEQGNEVVRKWVNGKEVSPNTKVEEPEIIHEIDTDGNRVIAITKSNGKKEEIRIKKEIGSDGIVKVYRSRNGGDFKEVKNHERYVHAHGHPAPHSFAAKNNDGSVMVFGEPSENLSDKDMGIDNASNIHFFPNPAKNNFTLSYKVVSDGKVSISITDMQGKTVYEANEETSTGEYKTRINTEDFPAGLYLVNISHNGKTETRKLLVK